MLGGSGSRLKLDPLMAPEPDAGSDLVRAVLMPKVLEFMAASHVMILIEMTLNRLVSSIGILKLFHFCNLCVELCQ